MKKAFAILLTGMMICVLAATVFMPVSIAATGGSQMLTLVRAVDGDPTWFLVFPGDITVTGPGETILGEVRIGGVDKTGVRADLSYDIIAEVSQITPFVSGEYSIPFYLDATPQQEGMERLYRLTEGTTVAYYRIRPEGTGAEETGREMSSTMSLDIFDLDYEKAPPGTYTAAIIYASYVKQVE